MCVIALLQQLTSSTQAIALSSTQYDVIRHLCKTFSFFCSILLSSAAFSSLNLQVTNAESILTVHGSGASSRALRMVNVLNLYIKNSAGQVSRTAAGAAAAVVAVVLGCWQASRWWLLVRQC
jgi:hypothetical protein